MANSESPRRVRRRIRPSRRELRRARRQGQLDGAAGIPRPGPRDAPPSTGFISMQEFAARQASKHLQARLLRSGAGHVAKIHALAGTLVHATDVLGRPHPGHRGRLLAAFARWNAEVAVCRRLAGQEVDRANRLVGWYWGHLVREHRDELGSWRPAEITLDPVWEKPDQALFLHLQEDDDLTAARMLRTVMRALDILTEHVDDQGEPHAP